MIAAFGPLFLLSGLVMAGSDARAGPDADGGAEVTREIVRFSDLDGWDKDDHAAALSVFLNTCKDFDEPDWRNLCAVASSQDPENARAFFELFFRPVVIRDGRKPMFTGYFEPELDGSRTPGGPFRYPVYKMPPEAKRVSKWLSRNDILNSGVMQGRGLEIAWVDDSVELFFLQIQGLPALYQDAFFY